MVGDSSANNLHGSRGGDSLSVVISLVFWPLLWRWALTCCWCRCRRATSGDACNYHRSVFDQTGWNWTTNRCLRPSHFKPTSRISFIFTLPSWSHLDDWCLTSCPRVRLRAVHHLLEHRNKHRFDYWPQLHTGTIWRKTSDTVNGLI